MRRFPTTLVVVLVVLAGAIAGWRIFWPSESQRYQAVQQVRASRSELHFSETILHAKGPIAREEWRLDNVEGVSTAKYAAQNRVGSRIARFTEPIQGYDVTFAFEKLVQDGLWKLQTRPLKGNTDNVYTVSVRQV
ncbi:MAG: hypothetical protein JO103_04680, partial [Candidatus Eremiobacteraeota bacterium]|nr:hypothetical protein [Candidatus Eremiobacteraeota bacterium]